MLIKCTRKIGGVEFKIKDKQIYKMCKTQTIKEDIVVTNAASSNTGNNTNDRMSEWQIIGITLIIGMTMYIMYRYIKSKINKKVNEAIARQAPL